MNMPNTTRKNPIVSAVSDDGEIIETVYDKSLRQTNFIVWKDGSWQKKSEHVTQNGPVIPYSAKNNLIAHDVILFPSQPEEYGTVADLVRDIQGYIHRYVDVSPRYEKIASYYVLLTWIYDNYNELPYLRLIGDYGSGKTRFLLTVGSLCCRPIFASGASTMSPIFHILHTFRGTLILDEGDFRFSDEKADMVKILNNGNVKGVPVLRNEQLPTREYNPRAFQVYGPKIIATRGHFEDRALESRCITEATGGKALRSDIPINLPSGYKSEALSLRNKLLLYRFRHHGIEPKMDELANLNIEPRLLQVMRPLMSIVDDPELKKEIQSMARQYHEDMVIDRGMDVEAQVLEVIKDLYGNSEERILSIKNITEEFSRRFPQAQNREITHKSMGAIVRKRLNLRTQKSRGIYIIPVTEQPKLTHLYQRFGIQ